MLYFIQRVQWICRGVILAMSHRPLNYMLLLLLWQAIQVDPTNEHQPAPLTA
jgi:hypothetical protein